MFLKLFNCYLPLVTAIFEDYAYGNIDTTGCYSVVNIIFFYIDLYCRFLEMWYLFKCIFFYTFRRLRFILNLIGDFLNQSSKQNSNFNRWVKYFSQYKLLSSKCKLNIFEIIYIFLPRRKKFISYSISSWFHFKYFSQT